ncbi:hypothetical protein ACJJTC_017448 [Scirpophaga incertulas]
MASIQHYILLLTVVSIACSDEIDLQMDNGRLMKLLKAMANETHGADSLNLPANATSIRENIVDTFSCENRTYGYYADVDNDCQVFHVCLPSQTPSGRNITYRWSFICPTETIFNQEVLVCTRARDAIPCEESPMFFYVNMDIGKVPEDTQERDDNVEQDNVEAVQNKIKNPSRPPVDKKQNMVLQNILQQVADEESERIDQIEFKGPEDMTEEIVPVITDVIVESEHNDRNVDEELPEGEERIAEERSIGWNRKMLRRTGFRFKADV